MITLHSERYAYVAGYKDRLRGKNMYFTGRASHTFKVLWLEGWLAADKIMNKLEDLKHGICKAG